MRETGSGERFRRLLRPSSRGVAPGFAIVGLALLSLVGISGGAVAAEPVKAPVEDPATLRIQALEQRLAKVERLVQSQGLIELMERVDHLQAELQRLQGEVETLGHGLEQIKKRQRELYLDLDGRLQRLEGRAAGGAPPAPTGHRGPATPPVKTSQSAAPAPAGQVETGGQEGASEEQARQAYNDAFTLLKAGRYEKAIGQLRNFLERYPQSQYADNAQYWLAQAFFVQRQYQNAMDEYQKLVQLYPDSPKLPHAQLKIGICLDELGQTEKARAVLEQVRDQYVGSSASRQASERLARIAAKQP